MTSNQIAIRLHWVWEICSSNVQNRVENLTFKFVPNWLVVHTKSAIIAIWLGKSFLRLLIYSQVASLSRPSSLRKRSVIQGNGVWNLHSNKVFESFSFLNMFKLMVLIILGFDFHPMAPCWKTHATSWSVALTWSWMYSTMVLLIVPQCLFFGDFAWSRTHHWQWTHNSLWKKFENDDTSIYLHMVFGS